MAEDIIIPNKFYGDNHRWFLGIVEDNNDPNELGRVRVRIHGLHSESQEDIPTSELPWANVLVSGTEYGAGGFGANPNLIPGAFVSGFFLDGHKSQEPMVVGTFSRIEEYSRVQKDKIFNRFFNETIINNTLWVGLGEEDSLKLGTTNSEKAFNFFLAALFTPYQSAGIVGNLMQESGIELDTSIKAKGNEKSFGIAQWQGTRFNGLKEFAIDNNGKWTDLIIQLNYILYELKKHRYLGLSKLKEATSIKRATLVFQNKFERPSSPQTRKRLNFAYDIYNRMVKGE